MIICLFYFMGANPKVISYQGERFDMVVKKKKSQLCCNPPK